MQYLTVQYLLAMESLKLFIINLSILVADNFVKPCRCGNTKNGYNFALCSGHLAHLNHILPLYLHCYYHYAFEIKKIV